LQFTPSPVLSGFVPGVTVAVIVTVSPGVGLGGVNVMLIVGSVVSSAAAGVPPATQAANNSAQATTAPERRREVIN
jgi:hypothetical protein